MISPQFLQTHALFGGLSDEQIERLLPLLSEERFAVGEYIVREGDNGDRLYFLCEGSVEVLKDIDTGHAVETKRLALMGVGDTFGEMGLIDIQSRSASVRALTDVTAMTLANADMLTIHERDPDAFIMIIMNMAREISRRLRRTNELVGTSLYSGPWSV
jgi:CRP/FNR family transcriptional regulator, cyclic AMP receptor protein